MINNQNDLVYKDQISNLTVKLKDYRLKSKELEEMLLENENKRLDMRKKIDDLTTSEYEAYEAFKA
jgi:RNase H-fold protein (predicted Holliday junction resolvase)